MFLELTLLGDNAKILINITRINSIYQKDRVTKIYTDNDIYLVSESYEEIVEAINKYGVLPLVQGGKR